MDLEMEQEIVKYISFRIREGKESVETVIQPSVKIVQTAQPYYLSELEFKLPMERCVISGAITQISKPLLKQENENLSIGTISEEQSNTLIQSLFSVVSRLTYEVTEIAFDEPGIVLHFSKENEGME